MRYNDILNSLTSLIYKKTGAEIDCEDIDQLKPGSYFIDLVDYKRKFDSKHREYITLSVDIIYLPKKKSHLEIINALDDLDEVFEIEGKRLLKVNDRVLTVQNVDIDEVDHIGHYVFDLSLYVEYGKLQDYELMQDLELKFKEV